MARINVLPIVNRQKVLIMSSDSLLLAHYFDGTQSYMRYINFYMDVNPFSKFISFIDINEQINNIIIQRIRDGLKIYIMEIIGLILLGYIEFYERLKEENLEEKINYNYSGRIEEFKNCYFKYYINYFSTNSKKLNYKNEFTDFSIILERIQYIFDNNVHKKAILSEELCGIPGSGTRYHECYFDVLEKIFYYLLCCQTNKFNMLDKNNISRMEDFVWEYFNNLCNKLYDCISLSRTSTRGNIYVSYTKKRFTNILEKFVRKLPMNLLEHLVFCNDIIDKYFLTYRR